MLSVKQGGIKYHFLSLWYDSTWDWTQVSRAIGEHGSVWPIDRTQSGATTPSQSGPRNDGNEGVPRILQRSSITGTLPSECLVSYTGHSLEES